MDKSKLLLVCASPRRKGTSAMVLRRIQAALGGDLVFIPQEGDLDDLVGRMQTAETIVVSGPCYINTYPARLIALLEAACEAGEFSGQKLYGIINGGMPYTHTHRHGLTCLRIFADQAQMAWKGGFILGLGPSLNGQPLEKHMRRKTLVPAFDRFIQHIDQGTPSPDVLYKEAQKPPGKAFTYLLAKLLTLKVERDLKKYGYNLGSLNK